MINPKELVRRLMVLPLRLRLKNHGFSLISNNCCGAIIYHDLGERFNSPTINLTFPREDFLVFVENLKECLSTNIQQVPEYIVNGKPATYPVGKIALKERLSHPSWNLKKRENAKRDLKTLIMRTPV